MASVYPGSSRGRVGSGPMTAQMEHGVANRGQRPARELKKGLQLWFGSFKWGGTRFTRRR